jgi:hypothetical protein
VSSSVLRSEPSARSSWMRVWKFSRPTNRLSPSPLQSVKAYRIPEI